MSPCAIFLVEEFWAPDPINGIFRHLFNTLLIYLEDVDVGDDTDAFVTFGINCVCSEVGDKVDFLLVELLETVCISMEVIGKLL